MDALFVIVVIAGPALAGILALIFGIRLLAHSRDADASPWTNVLAAILLLGALGIAGCYASVFLGGSF